jgi:tocopherol cyclase
MTQIGIHYGGKFYEFVPWNGVVSWEVATWGYWFMSADNGNYVVSICLHVQFFYVGV